MEGQIHTAPNLHSDWVGQDSHTLFGEAIGLEVNVLNDADAAGVAEITFGAGKDQPRHRVSS